MRLLRGNYIQNGMLAKLYTEIQFDGYCCSRWLLDSSDSQVVRATAFFVESTAGCVGALYLGRALNGQREQRGGRENSGQPHAATASIKTMRKKKHT
jgi:hypothetical protein